jgi:phage-related protein
MAEENIQSPPSRVTVTFVNGVAVESPAPQVTQTNDGPTPGNPQVPAGARSIVANTSVGFANDNLAHVCDFVTDIQKNIEFKKYAKATAKYIRDAIRAVLRALGLSDPTGEASWLATTLKAIAREVNRINKEILQPILDFQKYVVAYIAKLRNIIAWILSLPAKFLALLQDCLTRLIKLIGSVFSDIGAGLSEGFSEGPSNYDDIIKEAKALAESASNTVKATVAVAAGTVNIAVAGTVGLLIPTSQAELDAANATIAAYEAPATPSPQNKNTP